MHGDAAPRDPSCHALSTCTGCTLPTPAGGIDFRPSQDPEHHEISMDDKHLLKKITRGLENVNCVQDYFLM